MRKFKKAGVLLLFVLPWIAGVIGCRMEGYSFWDAAYVAIRMYLFDADYRQNNLLFEIARWVAPVCTISGFFLILEIVWEKIKDFFHGFLPDAVAIYGDADLKEIARKNIKHAINVDDNAVMDVGSHIIMFSTDEKSLEFYTKNKEKLRGDVFIKIDKNDSFSVSLDNVKFFNPCEIVARRFWQKRDIRNVITHNEMKIAIVGSDILSRKILTYGLLNNVYSLEQKIEYHIWSNNDFFKKAHSDFETMNGDCVIYHDNKCQDRLKQIALADRIIITEKIDNEMLAEIAKLTKGEIYCFDPMGTFVNIFENKNIYPFGCYNDVLTTENIRTDNLYDFAKELNYKYELMYANENEEPLTKEAAWDKLDVFTKGSNIASTDYHHIMLIVMKETGKTEVDYTLAELEHIRWSRYHFLNHWKCGETPNGKKDAANKIHPCLKPFAELDDENKQKDVSGINTLLALEGLADL